MTFKRLAIALTAVAALAGPTAAAQAAPPGAYAGDYASTDGADFSMQIASDGRVDFTAMGDYTCQSGVTRSFSVSTDDTDDFFVSSNGRVRVNEPWSDVPSASAPAGAQTEQHALRLAVNISRSRYFSATISDTVVYFDANHRKLDRCSTGLMRSWGEGS